jgi:hypothetical protein
MEGQCYYITLFVNAITQINGNRRITQGKYGIRGYWVSHGIRFDQQINAF